MLKNSLPSFVSFSPPSFHHAPLLLSLLYPSLHIARDLHTLHLQPFQVDAHIYNTITMSSEVSASSKGRSPSSKLESVNTPQNTTTPAPGVNTTTPIADTSTSTGTEPSKPAGRRRTGHQVLEDMKASLRRLSAQVELLGDMIKNLELHDEEAPTPRTSILKKGDRNRGPTLGRRVSKFSGSSGRPWKHFEVKVRFL